ncbi:MAG TPA: hypothetical protein VJK52_00850 [Candidatus Nanoarchaeia archaeon]|nr:hypothetical protein [Candidatus Nanoarchaeia archaeon]
MNRKSRVIGLAGGSGAGKSAVAYALRDRYPEVISVLHLDDYHKAPIDIPQHQGKLNWDHPDAIDFQQLINDLSELHAGKIITVETKNPKDNPDYHQTRTRVPITIAPKPVIILEGFLTLWHPEVRKLLDVSVYLDAPGELRLQRRTKFLDSAYQDEVLLPMHASFIEPTKQYAQYIISIADKPLARVVEEFENVIKRFRARLLEGV